MRPYEDILKDIEDDLKAMGLPGHEIARVLDLPPEEISAEVRRHAENVAKDADALEKYMKRRHLRVVGGGKP